ncbi:hypothetical protein KEM56_001757 [Ascosphaera pollenicola]|nr:hypothetical protein KEM56_001757 [Ascosphaera pollenicola]
MEGPVAVELPPQYIPLAARHNAEIDETIRPITVVHQAGEGHIPITIANVLGKSFTKASSTQQHDRRRPMVLGVEAHEFLKERPSESNIPHILINTHCVDDGSTPDERLTEACDFEFLYYSGPLLRKHLTRFLSLILGQSDIHADLSKKRRTNFISTTFPDVRTALPNLDILSVGADAVEIRVDLLEEPLGDGRHSDVPSLKYIGSQVAQLRQRTELPIIFTTRCKNENGQFPMNDPDLFFKYLYRAIQWGIEYIDVELWLPERLRKLLWEKRGHSTIMSAFHDFSGNWRWLAPEAENKFQEGQKYAHIVKMISMVTAKEENFALECFRSMIQTKYPRAMLSAVNMGHTGQLSRVMNTVFSPITHPLLPIIAAPGQLTAAEINQFQHVLGQLPRRDFYAIGTFRSTPETDFIEKCFNELGLSHNFTCIDRVPQYSIEKLTTSPSFGGAYVNPPLAASNIASCVGSLTDSVHAIGMIDTITIDDANGVPVLTGNNALWKGIRAALTRDFVPSAYHGGGAIVVSDAECNAGTAIYALRSLGIGKIFTVGFRATGPLASALEPLTSLESLQRIERPFVIVSALSAEKSLLVQPLLKHFAPGSLEDSKSATTQGSRGSTAVYLDLSHFFEGVSPKGHPQPFASALGWTAYGSADVRAWTMVETLRLLAGQNVPFDFVQMASGKGFYWKYNATGELEQLKEALKLQERHS